MRYQQSSTREVYARVEFEQCLRKAWKLERRRETNRVMSKEVEAGRHVQGA
jgi:hypothetical protein